MVYTVAVAMFALLSVRITPYPHHRSMLNTPLPATHAVLVGGTHGQEEDWWQPTSSLSRLLQEHGIEILDPNRPFVWSFDVDGVPLLGGQNHRDWIAGGFALVDYLEARRHICAKPIAIAHSHGGQVLAYAAKYGAKFSAVMTLGTPFRPEMEPAYVALAGRSTRWVNVRSRFDIWQWLGSLFSGQWWKLLPDQGIDQADENIVTQSVRRHTHLTRVSTWREENLLQRLL